MTVRVLRDVEILPGACHIIGYGSPDTMPQAMDAEGRSCIYVPIIQNSNQSGSTAQLT